MRHRDWTFLDGVSHRLLHSRNPAEKRSILVGDSHPRGYPVLLDTDLLLEHMHIIGPTGGGKTSLGLQTNVLQLIRCNDGPVVVFDNKGDPGFFHSVRLAAQSAGRTFKWFTNKPFRSTYIFNPWDQRLLRQLTLPDVLGLFMQSLNLHHGEDYGRAYFGLLARTLLRRGILETFPKGDANGQSSCSVQKEFFAKYGPIQSFRDLSTILPQVPDEHDELRNARHLAFLIESLTDFRQLNLAPNSKDHDPAISHAIFMPEVIEKKQVVYFYLVGAMDVASVAQIAKLAMYSLLMAAIAYHDKHGHPPRVYTIWDEAQVMIAKNIENVLAQARSHGLGCILAHQALSQLNPPGGVDLRDLVMNCTAIKQVFGARDPWLLRYISETSGTTKYFRAGYRMAPGTPLKGPIGPQYARRDSDISIQEYTGPRLTFQDIMNVSHQPNMSLMWIDPAYGLTDFQGWFPMHTDWPVSKTTHDAHRREPWPVRSAATIEIESNWPRESEETITVDTHPPLAPTQAEIDASAKLRDIRRRLTEK